MEKMVIVKYHGVRMGTKDDGSPDLLEQYSNGAQVNVKIGGYSEPIPMAEALRLKRDFGVDAFEIMVEAEMPTTKEEAEEAEKAIESGDALTVTDSVLPLHVAKEEAKTQEAELAQVESTDIHVTRTSRKQPFDKTVEPVRYTRKALNRMSKPKLKGLFKALAMISRGIKPKAKHGMKKKDFVDKILEMQG